ncbi:MAG: SIMPL domain-containing protein [Acidimicrobiales bacterium]
MPVARHPRHLTVGTRHLEVGLAVALAGIALSGCATGTAARASATPARCGSGTPTVTAHGTGTAEGAPNLLTMTIGVQVQAPAATLALSQDNAKAAAVMAVLKKQGVAGKDLQTSGLSISPTYTTGPTPTISGYQVTNTVTARVHKLSSAGALIDSVAAAAGSSVRIDQLAFSVVNAGGLRSSARASAVTQAEARAGAMAGAAGRRLGPVCSIADTASSSQPFAYNLGLANSAAMTASVPAVPLQPGAERVTATVTAVFALA